MFEYPSTIKKYPGVYDVVVTKEAVEGKEKPLLKKIKACGKCTKESAE